MPGRVGVAAVALAAFVALSSVFVFVVPRPPGGPRQPKAAILDQLAETNPNPKLISSTVAILSQAGYRADYYGPAQIDVNLYGRLPTLGYKIVLVRSHSTGFTGTVNDATGVVTEMGSLVSLFTNEPYEVTQHVDEQRDRSLDVVRIAEAVPGINAGLAGVVAPAIQKYFGITPHFVSERMRGHFDQTVVLLMGCEAMSSTDMANAFKARGAKAVIGWDGPVTPEHTDQATTALLRALLADGSNASDAVAHAMREVGKDPVYSASLRSR